MQTSYSTHFPLSVITNAPFNLDLPLVSSAGQSLSTSYFHLFPLKEESPLTSPAPGPLHSSPTSYLPFTLPFPLVPPSTPKESTDTLRPKNAPLDPRLYQLIKDLAKGRHTRSRENLASLNTSPPISPPHSSGSDLPPLHSVSMTPTSNDDVKMPPSTDPNSSSQQNWEIQWRNSPEERKRWGSMDKEGNEVPTQVV